MIEKNYSDDFDKSLSTLEDIQLLSESSLSPLVGQAYFHLSEMKRKADQMSSGQVANYESVLKVLDEKLESIFNEFFSNKSKFKSYEYLKESQRIDLKKWNLIFEVIPEVLSVVSLFSYHGNMKINLDDNRLLISGFVLEDGNLEINRKFIYTITRKLIKKKVLLTFECEKSNRQGLMNLNLKVDISHDDSLTYIVGFNVTPKDQHLVGFSNIFCHYRVQLEDLKHVGEHNIIEVENDLTVKHLFGLPELSRLESANKEILHFPFLFRPLSIILPMKGKLSKGSFSKCLEDEQKRKQDVFRKFQSIDFFALFNL